MGPPVFLAGLAGFAWLAWSDSRRTIVLAGFPLAYYALAGSGATVFARYAIPWTPFLAIAAGALLARLARRAFERSLATRAAALSLAVLAFLAPSIASVVRTDRALSRTDSRELASEWFREHAAPGSIVCQVSNYGRVQLPATPLVRERDARAYAVLAGSDEERLARLRANPWRSTEGEGFVACRFRERDGAFVCESTGPCGPPDYIIATSSPLRMYDRTPPDLDRILARDYVELAAIRTGAADIASDRYDEIDAFYLPFAIDGRVERPGPDLSIYGRRNR
jgi:hypothetical protein